MSSTRPGTTTSKAEVTNISPHGIWLLIDEVEYYLAFDHFPWFRDASVKAITSLDRPSPEHLYWPVLDVDLHLDSIKDPEKFPLVFNPSA